MNKRSEKALLKIQENDPKLTELNIGRGGGIFQGAIDNDFSTLGEAIKNTHKTGLWTLVRVLWYRRPPYIR